MTGPVVVNESITVAEAKSRIERVQSQLYPFTSWQEPGQCDPLPAGPWAGVPVTVKDVLDVAGLPGEAGSATLSGRWPAHDAEAVARLRKIGVSVVAKTTTPEFGLSWTTNSPVSVETRNPHDHRRTAGGSSGGSAASVAARVVDVALGTDDAGSVRLPAAFCGVVGLVGTVGRVPLDGIVGHSQDFTRIGTLASSVQRAGAAEAVMAGEASLPLPEDTAPCPAVWWDRPKETPGIDEEIVDVVRRVAASLAPVLDVATEVTAFTEEDEAAFAVVNETQRWRLHGRQLLDTPGAEQLQPRTRALFDRGREHSEQRYRHALGQCRDAAPRLRDHLARGHVVVAPTVACLPPPLGGRPDDRPPGITAYTLFSSAQGLPAISVPCGWYEGIPVGLQLIADRGRDRRLVGLAARVAEMLDHA